MGWKFIKYNGKEALFFKFYGLCVRNLYYNKFLEK